MAELNISDLDSFRCQLREHAKHVKDYRDEAKDEAKTRSILIDPLLSVLGYRTNIPSEVVVGHKIQVATTAVEVDYALFQQGAVEVVVEAKPANSGLGEKEFKQLVGYYSGTTATFGALTDGVQWLWYCRDNGQLDMKRLERKPFLVYDASWDSEPLEGDIRWLWGVTNGRFDAPGLDTAARVLSDDELIRGWVKVNLEDPNDDFLKFLIGELKLGNRTKQNVARFRDQAKRVFSELAWKREYVTDWPVCRACGDSEKEVGEPGADFDRRPTLVKRTGDLLDLGDDGVLKASETHVRAWRIGDGTWRQEENATAVMAAVLSELLRSDVSRANPTILASKFGLIQTPTAPDDDRWMPITGVASVYFNKHVTNKAKFEKLLKVTKSVVIDGDSGTEFSLDPKVEVWLPARNPKKG